MATSFDTIIDLGLVTIQDYKINNLAHLDPNSLEIRLDGYLLRAIPKFTQCLQSLSYNSGTREFDSDFTYIEQEILACLYNIEWLTSVTQDVTQFQGKMSNREFKTHAEDANLKAKLTALDLMREKVNQLMVDYQLSPSNFKTLLNW